MELIHRVLVVCSVSSSCASLVHTAASLARSQHARLFVLTVVDDPFGVRGLSFPRPSLSRDLQRLVDRHRREMHEIVAREPGITVKERLQEGRPLQSILDAVREEHIDLLLLPAHQESRLEHFLFGGKNKKLLRMMPCSLLYVKSEPLAVVEDTDEEVEEGEAEAA